MENSVRYLYSVHPKKAIKNVSGIPVIRTSKSLNLTKEDVLECLKCGTVYRRFGNESINERVTIANIDRLHNAKFMTEKEYKAFLESNISDNRGSVVGDFNNPQVDSKPESKKEDKSTEIPTTTEEPDVEDKVETDVETVSEDEKENDVVEDNSEKTDVEDKVDNTDENQNNTSSNNVKINNKKNKHR